jgi:hypothetical protein
VKSEQAKSSIRALPKKEADQTAEYLHKVHGTSIHFLRLIFIGLGGQVIVKWRERDLRNELSRRQEAMSVHADCFRRACGSACRLLVKLTEKNRYVPSALFITRVICEDRINPIGQGGYADVFLGIHNDRKVAIKRMRFEVDEQVLDSVYIRRYYLFSSRTQYRRSCGGVFSTTSLYSLSLVSIKQYSPPHLHALCLHT